MAAEVGGGDSGKKKGKKKGRKKKGNPRIDMTPMVDLGFLLLTFFVLTTNMSNPTTMPVVVPADKSEIPPGQQPEIPASKVLNILIAGEDPTVKQGRIYSYQGTENVQLRLTTSKKAIREEILQKQKEVKARFPNEEDPLIVIIRMTEDAKYKDMVEILDEMNITNHKRYMLLEITPEEVEFIRDYEEKNNLASSITETLKKVSTVAAKNG